MELVRVFPLCGFPTAVLVSGWSSHKIESSTTASEYALRQGGVDEIQRQVRNALRHCRRKQLKLIVGLVTGWMSGVPYMPPAFQGSFINDPLALKWEIEWCVTSSKPQAQRSHLYRNWATNQPWDHPKAPMKPGFGQTHHFRSQTRGQLRPFFSVIMELPASMKSAHLPMVDSNPGRYCDVL